MSKQKRQKKRMSRYIGRKVYSTSLYNPEEEPELVEQTIANVHVCSDHTWLIDTKGLYLCDISDVGKQIGKVFFSFSPAKIENIIENWWRERLQAEYKERKSC